MSKAISIICSCLFLCACNSSNDSPADDTNRNHVRSVQEMLGGTPDAGLLGFITVTDNESYQSSDAFAAFVGYSDENSLNELLPLPSELSLQAGSCELEVEDPENDPTWTDEILENFTLVFAGDGLTVSSSAGSYAFLGALDTSRGGPLYISASELVFPSPDSLEFVGPGDVFPAFSVAATRPPAIDGLSLANGDRLLSGSAVTWTASTDDDTLIFLSFESTDVSTPRIYGECLLEDDGEFTVPASLQAEADALVAGSADLVFSGMARVKGRLVVLDGNDASSVIVYRTYSTRN